MGGSLPILWHCVVIFSTSTAALESCGAGWTLFGQHCYQVDVRPKTFMAARHSCQSLNASLASVRSRMETTFLLQNMLSMDMDVVLWIGLVSVSSCFHGTLWRRRRGWKWLDGSTYRSMNWRNYARQEPGKGKCYAAIGPRSGKWYGENPDAKYPSICEKTAVPSENVPLHLSTTSVSTTHQTTTPAQPYDLTTDYTVTSTAGNKTTESAVGNKTQPPLGQGTTIGIGVGIAACLVLVIVAITVMKRRSRTSQDSNEMSKAIHESRNYRDYVGDNPIYGISDERDQMENVNVDEKNNEPWIVESVYENIPNRIPLNAEAREQPVLKGYSPDLPSDLYAVQKKRRVPVTECDTYDEETYLVDNTLYNTS